jgi:hypothetical protein
VVQEVCTAEDGLDSGPTEVRVGLICWAAKDRRWLPHSVGSGRPARMGADEATGRGRDRDSLAVDATVGTSRCS